MNTPGSRSLAAQFIGSMAGGNLDRAFALLDDDAVIWVKTKLVPAGFYNPHSFRALLDKLHMALQGIQKVDVHTIYEQDDKLLAEACWQVRVQDKMFVSKLFLLFEVRAQRIATFMVSPDGLRMRKLFATDQPARHVTAALSDSRRAVEA